MGPVSRLLCNILEWECNDYGICVDRALKIDFQLTLIEALR